MNVAEVRNYVSEDGKHVIEFVEVFGKDKGKATYKGSVTIQLRSPHPQIPPQNMPLEFAFEPGTSLKQAFESFKEEADKAVEDFKKQHAKRQADAMAANKIVRAGVMPKMLGPNGQPLKG